FGFLYGFSAVGIGSAGVEIGIDLIFGIALMQGSDLARKILMWLAVVSTAFMLLSLVGLSFVGFGHLWPMFLSWTVESIGVLLLTLTPEPRREVALGSLAMMGVGWLGSVAAVMWLVGSVDVATTARIMRWSLGPRTIENADAGFSLRLPRTWVAM